jgi:hypothetical protein
MPALRRHRRRHRRVGGAVLLHAARGHRAAGRGRPGRGGAGRRPLRRLPPRRRRLCRLVRPHPHPELIPEAVYGLPELHRAELRGAAIVASPGCNATAATLALAPLAAAGLLGELPVATIVTGVSGAGRALDLGLHHAELDENARAYKVAGTHRHTGEIEINLGRVAAQGKAGRTHGPRADLRIAFNPVLVPMARGILATTVTRPPRDDLDDAGLLALYRDFYAGDGLVHVQAELPQTKAVPARTAPSSRCGATPAPAPWWRWRRSTTWARGRPARPSRGSTSRAASRRRSGCAWRVSGHEAPHGFRAAGVRAGIKPSGKPDLALVVGEGPLAWALTSTENLVKAPCVVRNRARAASEQSVQALVVNAGNANCANGDEGVWDNEDFAAATAGRWGWRECRTC